MKNIIKMFCFAAVFAGLFLTSSCMKEYTITVQSNNEAWGTVSGSGTYAQGAEIQISAIPASGCYFIAWNDNNTDNPRTITVTENATYIATFSDTPGGGGDDPTVWSGTISANTTWEDRGLPVDYVIDGYLVIDGNALLTIEPGVTIMFASVSSGIDVGENAGLRMVGTEENPIVLCGPTNNPNNGSWGNINIYSNRADNQFEYVQFLRGGSDDSKWRGVVRMGGNAKLSMKHCLIDGSLGTGFVAEYSNNTIMAFEHNTITHCATYPMITESHTDFLDNLSINNTFINNGNNVIYMYGIDLDLTENHTLKAMSIPYYFERFDLRGNKTFTIEPGTQMLFGHEAYISVNSDVIFVANGTESEPIIMSGEADNAPWSGITFRSTRNGNSISYCQIKGVGVSDSYDNSSCIYIDTDAKLSLQNNTFGPSQYYGVWIENINNWGNVTHSGNTFSGCNVANVHLYSEGTYNGQEYTAETNLDDLP